MCDKAPISVIIPAFKARNFIVQALDSVFAQSRLPSEIIIIDDDSPEPIEDLVTPFTANPHGVSVKLLRHEKNAGLGAARNTGIAAAKCEWLAFLDHDDVWTPDNIASLLSALLREQADVGFCTVMQFKDVPGENLGLWGPPDGMIDSTLPLRLFESNFITPSAVIARKDLLTRLSGFNTDPKVHMCEDLDLWLRALDAGAKFFHEPSPNVYYRKHPTAATAREGYMAYQAAYVLDINSARVNGSWMKKRSIVAARWWRALVVLNKVQEFRWDILWIAVVAGIPVPWEIGRGICHLFGVRPLRCNHR